VTEFEVMVVDDWSWSDGSRVHVSRPWFGSCNVTEFETRVLVVSCRPTPHLNRDLKFRHATDPNHGLDSITHLLYKYKCSSSGPQYYTLML